MNEKYCVDCKFCLVESTLQYGKNWWCVHHKHGTDIVSGEFKRETCYTERYCLVDSDPCGSDGKYYEKKLKSSWTSEMSSDGKKVTFTQTFHE